VRRSRCESCRSTWGWRWGPTPRSRRRPGPERRPLRRSATWGRRAGGARVVGVPPRSAAGQCGRCRRCRRCDPTRATDTLRGHTTASHPPITRPLAPSPGVLAPLTQIHNGARQTVPRRVVGQKGRYRLAERHRGVRHARRVRAKVRGVHDAAGAGAVAAVRLHRTRTRGRGRRLGPRGHDAAVPRAGVGRRHLPHRTLHGLTLHMVGRPRGRRQTQRRRHQRKQHDCRARGGEAVWIAARAAHRTISDGVRGRAHARSA
jgi:hypothetical protein